MLQLMLNALLVVAPAQPIGGQLGSNPGEMPDPQRTRQNGTLHQQMPRDCVRELPLGPEDTVRDRRWDDEAPIDGFGRRLRRARFPQALAPRFIGEGERSD